MSAQVEPSACRWCAIPKRGHAQQWKPPAGWHAWEQPTQAQIKARMVTRRAARTATPEPDPVDLSNLTGVWLTDEQLGDPHGECFGAHNGPGGPVDCDGRPI